MIDKDSIDGEGNNGGECGEERFVKMVNSRNGRKYYHGDSDNDTSRNRVVFNVANKFVFDTLGVVFQSEDNAWGADTDKV